MRSLVFTDHCAVILDCEKRCNRMENIMMKIISKKEYEHYEFICEEFNKQGDEIRNLKQRIKEGDEVVNTIEKMIKSLRARVYNVCTDKVGNKSYICVQDERKCRCNCDECKSWLDGDVNFFIINQLILPLHGNAYNQMPYLETKFSCDSVYIYELHCDCNGDLYENKGYGTMLIETLIRLARENNIKKVTGKLSSVDAQTKKKKEKRNAFYEKRGFELKFEDEMKENGSICLVL